MTRHETNKSNMFRSVINGFKANSQISTDYSVFNDPVARLTLKYDRILEVDKKYLAATGGKTATKTNAEEELLEDLMPVHSALYALGVKKQDESLKALCKETESELKKLRDSEFLEKAEAIKNEAVTRLPDLADYRITEETLNELQEKIDAFQSGLGEQDEGYGNRSALRKELSALFDEADKILIEELDKLIELLRKTNRLFYDHYWTVRGIKDLGGGKKPAEEKVDETKPTEQPK